MLPDVDENNNPKFVDVTIIAIDGENYIAAEGHYTIGEDVIDASRKRFGNPEEAEGEY